MLMTFPVYSDEMQMTVVDMGAGLCTVTKMSNGAFVVFDAGKGKHCKNKIKSIVKDNPIELLIISHADSDHYGGSKYILKDMTVKTLLHTGYIRKKKAKGYTALLKQIAEGAAAGRFKEISMANVEEYREKFEFGDSSVQIMAGYGHNHYGFKHSKDSYIRNSISIAAKFEFDGKSILITGDAKGRDPIEENSCKYAEKEMVDHDLIRPLKSDVLIAGHHGANDTTARCFIKKVKPKYVVYSAGNKHGHPRELNAKRLMEFKVKKENIFRTDRGSDEQSYYTMKSGSIILSPDVRTEKGMTM